MNNAIPAPLPQAVWIVIAIALAGVFHVAWLKSALCRPFRRPIDGGLIWRGKPVFGANKTFAGLMMMPIATAILFAVIGECRAALPGWLQSGLWDRPTSTYAMVGFAAGLAFMVAELPNSFIKRRIGVEPGQTGDSPALRVCLMAIDRLDSTIGALIVLSIMMPIAPATWLWVLLMGPGTHAIFSVWLYKVGVKDRPL
jgi:CDP-2,3-bis-(O-geranylgeranyl)-sn-glycerol synthase